MQTEFIYAGVIVLMLLIYLLYTIAYPEKF